MKPGVERALPHDVSARDVLEHGVENLRVLAGVRTEHELVVGEGVHQLVGQVNEGGDFPGGVRVESHEEVSGFAILGLNVVLPQEIVRSQAVVAEIEVGVDEDELAETLAQGVDLVLVQPFEERVGEVEPGVSAGFDIVWCWLWC